MLDALFVGNMAPPIGDKGWAASVQAARAATGLGEL
jgi:hypothetical protein